MRLRSATYAARRVAQTVRLYGNFPSVFGQLALSRFGDGDLTFRMRNGYVVRCPNVAGARFPLYEIFGDDAYDLTQLLAGMDEDGVVLDIGGQIGSFALAVARARPTARVHVYEASPTSADYVRSNVGTNGLSDRVTVHAAALAGRAGEFTFVDSGHASGHNGLNAPGQLGHEVTVPAITFDDAVAQAGGPVQVVKMDIEGAEYDTILRSDPQSWVDVRGLVMEYHPFPGRGLPDLIDYFAGVGLTPTRIDPIGDRGLGVMWLARRSA